MNKHQNYTPMLNDPFELEKAVKALENAKRQEEREKLSHIKVRIGKNTHIECTMSHWQRRKKEYLSSFKPDTVVCIEENSSLYKKQ